MATELDITLVWSGRREQVTTLTSSSTFADLKHIAGSIFGLDIASVKIVGLKLNPSSDAVVLADLIRRSVFKLNVIGTPAGVIDEVRMQSQQHALEEQTRREQLELQAAELERERAALRSLELERQQQREQLRQQQALEQQQRELERQRERIAAIARLEEERSRPIAFQLRCRTPTIQLERRHIVLPSSALEQLLERDRLHPPVAFRASFEARSVIVGAREFTADPGCIGLSAADLKDLAADFDDLIELEQIVIPVARSVTIAAPFDGLVAAERDALLEFELRKRQFLIEGERFELAYLNRTYEIHIERTDPPEIVAILDTDLTTEVKDTTPMHPVIIVDALKSVDVPLTGDQTSLEYAVDVTDGESLTVTAKPFPLSSDSDINVYASRENRRPSRADFELCSQGTGSNTFIIADAGRWFLSVIAGNVATTGAALSVLISKKPPVAVAEAVYAESTTQTCPNCQRQIPDSAFGMHELRCSRSVYFCKKCLSSMSVADRSKHETLSHGSVSCLACGFSVEQWEMASHKLEHCRRRAVQCIYCPMRIPLEDRGSHQHDCGLRDAMCLICSIHCKRKDILRHISRSHNIPLGDVKFSVQFH